MSEHRGILHNFRRTPDGKQQRLPQLYLMDSVRRATSSASAGTLVSFVRLSKHYYCKCFARFLHRLSSIPQTRRSKEHWSRVGRALVGQVV